MSEDPPKGAKQFDAPSMDEQIRMVEALVFASSEPLSARQLEEALPLGSDVGEALRMLEKNYAPRGVNLTRVAGKWSFRTAADLSFLLEREAVEQRKLSRAAVETMAIIAYNQPVTRTEIEEVRGVSVSKGTLDLLLELDWIKFGRRRETPGRPVTFITTEGFLSHFGLASTRDLPGLEELKAAGLLDNRPPPAEMVPVRSDDDGDDDTPEDTGPEEPGLFD